MNELTPKQEKFVQGLFKGLSQREAYKQAYDAENMNDKTIDIKASELYKNGKIKVRLKELQDELKERNMVTVEKVLAEYAKIGFADIKDYLEYKTVKTQVGIDVITGNPIIGYATIVDLKDSNEVDGTLISEVNLKDGAFKFKLHDKMNALEKMGKTLGMFIDKTELTGKDGEPLNVIFNIPRPPKDDK